MQFIRRSSGRQSRGRVCHVLRKASSAARMAGTAVHTALSAPCPIKNFPKLIRAGGSVKDRACAACSPCPLLGLTPAAPTEGQKDVADVPSTRTSLRFLSCNGELGSMNELHHAARAGSIKRTKAVLSKGVIDIDQGDRKGYTPLMFAAFFGYAQVVTILLKKGADVSLVNDDGFVALHISAQRGHLAVTKLLVKAGADLEAKLPDGGSTPLQLAAGEGHSEVMRVLIEAGANPNSRGLDGETSLYIAAYGGHMEAIKVLLRAKANPLLAYSSPSGGTLLPLDVAARKGHSEVVDELIQERGIEGCGGASGGLDALTGAAENQHVEVMGVLTSAGVVDTGTALIEAVTSSRALSVKFLLQQQQQQQQRKGSVRGVEYPDTRHKRGATPLFLSVQACRSSSPRITRLLVDAGADTASAVRLTDAEGTEIFNNTPLALVDMYLNVKKIGRRETTETELNSLEASRRLLMRVEAVHAVSWLWVSEAPSVTRAAAEGTGNTNVTSTPLTSMLPILRRRVRRPRVLLAALFRLSRKPY